jgi:hypothetical protein
MHATCGGVPKCTGSADAGFTVSCN